MPASVHEVLSVAGQTCWDHLYLLYCYWQCLHTFLMFLLNLTFGTFFPLGFTSKCHLHVCCMPYAISSMMPQQRFLGNGVQWVGCPKGISWNFLVLQKDGLAPTRKIVFLLSHDPTDAVWGLWKRDQFKFQRWKTSWTDPWILRAWSWWTGQWEPQGSLVQIGRPLGAIDSDPWSVTVPPRSTWWTCFHFCTNPATRTCRRWTWTTSACSMWQQVAAPFARPSLSSSWLRRREKYGGIFVRSPRGCGGGHARALDPRNCQFSKPWTLVRAFWWPDWKTTPKRRTTRRVCKKWLGLNWHFAL